MDNPWSSFMLHVISLQTWSHKWVGLQLNQKRYTMRFLYIYKIVYFFFIHRLIGHVYHRELSRPISFDKFRVLGCSDDYVARGFAGLPHKITDARIFSKKGFLQLPFRCGDNRVLKFAAQQGHCF